MIKFNKVSLQFPGQVICDHLSFDVERGESLCLSGPSGKGKSSLLKLIMGIIPPDSGEIYINRTKLMPSNVEEVRRQISWLPQNVHLPVDSGSELIELMELKPEQIHLYHDYLIELGIDQKGKTRSFSQISGGQKQRIVLAACLSLQKPILLLDEPVSALDDVSIDLLIKLVGKLKDRTVISTSHNQRWLEHCSTILEL